MEPRSSDWDAEEATYRLYRQAHNFPEHHKHNNETYNSHYPCPWCEYPQDNPVEYPVEEADIKA